MRRYCRVCYGYVESEGHTHPEKICEACQQLKKLAEFPEHSSSLDGHRHTCEECVQQGKTPSPAFQEEQRRKKRPQYRLHYEQRKVQKHVQHEAQKALLDAYGYKWRKEQREFVSWFDEGSPEVEEKWILYAPTGKEIDREDAMLEIYALQQHKPGHPSTLWAKDILLLPNVIILDTETTGFDKDAEIIDIAIVDKDGRKRLDTLVQCQQEAIPLGAYNVHHIHKNMLRKAPPFPQIWVPRLIQFLLDHEIIIYNAEYDLRMLRQTAQRYGLEVPEFRTHCLMQYYSAYVGEKSPHKEGYSYKSLAVACSHFQIEQGEAHRALADAQVSLQVLRSLAAQAIS